MSIDVFWKSLGGVSWDFPKLLHTIGVLAWTIAPSHLEWICYESLLYNDALFLSGSLCDALRLPPFTLLLLLTSHKANICSIYFSVTSQCWPARHTRHSCLCCLTVKECCQVMFDYTASAEDELNLKTGEIVTIINKVCVLS